MRQSIVPAALLIAFALQTSIAVQAQDERGKKHNDPQWKRISLTTYKSGQLTRAKEIIANYHGKASEKAGTPRPTMIIDLISGDWDVMTVWDMPEGLEEFNWETSPRDVKWRKALDEIAGGADKATAILNEYSSLIVRTNRYIGRLRK